MKNTNKKVLIRIFTFSIVILLFSSCAHAAEIGRIKSLEGRVDILKSGTEMAIPAREGDVVFVGDAVRTKSNSKAEIVFNDNSVLRLAQNSKVTVNAYQLDEKARRTQAAINLDRGKIRAIIAKMPGPADFNIDTPNAHAVIRGSDIFTFYQAGNSGMLVNEGRLSVANIAHPADILVVPAGNSVLVPLDETPKGPRPYLDLEKRLHEQDTNPPPDISKREKVGFVRGVVTGLSGDVTITPKGASTARPASMNDILGEGDGIETAVNGMIEIKFDNGNAINLKPNTKISLTKLIFDEKTGEYENLLELSIGKVRARVENLKGGSSFRVKTPTAICGVRGTIMYVEASPALTQAFFEGGNGFINSIISGNAANIGMGQNALADDKGNVSTPVFTSNEERMNFGEGWDPGSGTEGYSAPEGAAGNYLYNPDTGTGGGGDPGAGAGPGTPGGADPNQPANIPVTTVVTTTTTVTSTLSGNFSGGFGTYDTELNDLILDCGDITNGVLTGDGPLWVDPYAIALNADFTHTQGFYDEDLWFADLSGTTSDGGAFLGYSGGTKLGNSLKGLSYTIYVKPNGAGGYSAGYAKSTDLSGSLSADLAGTLSLTGNVTTHVDAVTTILPSQVYSGSPYVRGYIGDPTDSPAYVCGDISGTAFGVKDMHLIQDPNADPQVHLKWGIGTITLGGTFTGTPSTNWQAVMASKNFGGENFNGYSFYFINGTDWSGGKLSATLEGFDLDRFSDHRILGDVQGEIAGFYYENVDEGNWAWEAMGLGAYEDKTLSFGGEVLSPEESHFSYYDADQNMLISDSGSLTYLFGGTESLWAGSPEMTVIGEFTNPLNRKLWNTDEDLIGYTSDGAKLLGVMGGNNIDNSLNGLFLAFYIRPDGAGGYRAGYVDSSDLSGNFYPDIGMFYASGNLTAHLDIPTTVTPDQLYDGSPYFEGVESDPEGLISGEGISGNIETESAYIEGQNWGLWRGSSGGVYTSIPASNQSHVGGFSFDEETQEIDAYWIGTGSGNAWQNNEIIGTASGTTLTDVSLQTFSGNSIGTYSNGSWQALNAGVWTKTADLTSSGRFVAQGWNVSTDFDFAGLIGLTGPIWAAGAHPDFISMGEFNSGGAAQFAWAVREPWSGGQDWFVSRYVSQTAPLTYSYTTYDDGSGGAGSFYGLSAGVGGNGALRGKSSLLYISPTGDAGVLYGDVHGNYYDGIEMYRLDGELTKHSYAQHIGIMPGDLHNNISWDTLSELDDHGGGEGLSDIYANWGEGTMFNIGQQNWGVWNLITGGDFTYDEPAVSHNNWDVFDLTGTTYNPVDNSYVKGSWLGGITGTKWANGELGGTLNAVWIGLKKNGELPGRKVNGELVGNYVEVAVDSGTWQAGAAGEWVEINPNLASGNLTQNILDLGVAANVPVTEAYSTIMTGTGIGGITLATVDMRLYNMNPNPLGHGDGIWAAIINGTYSTVPTTDWSITVGNEVDNAILSGPAWSGGQWTATNVTGIVDGNSIDGQAAGTYGESTFTFTGAGTGIYE